MVNKRPGQVAYVPAPVEAGVDEVDSTISGQGNLSRAVRAANLAPLVIPASQLQQQPPPVQQPAAVVLPNPVNNEQPINGQNQPQVPDPVVNAILNHPAFQQPLFQNPAPHNPVMGENLLQPIQEEQPEGNEPQPAQPEGEEQPVAVFRPTTHDPIVHMTSETRYTSCCLAQFVVQYYARPTNRREPQNYRERTIIKALNHLLTKNQIAFDIMMHKMTRNMVAGYDAFKAVAKELFQDQNFTLARITVIYAFAARLSQYCIEQEELEYLASISSFLCEYIREEGVEAYITQRGGWDILLKDYSEVDMEYMTNSLWDAMKWLSIGLGVATAALYVGQRYSGV